MKLKVGIIGAGLISRLHMETYASDARIEIVKLCELNSSLRENTASQFSIPETTGNYEDLLNDKSIDLIDICLPHNLHYQAVMACLKAGKHVVLEKPISITLQEADEMIATAAMHKKRFFVAHNERFLPANQIAKKLIDDGEIGKPILATSAIIGDVLELLNNPTHWKGTWDKAGGGALIDSGIHFIDILQYFFGEAVSANAVFGKMAVSIEQKAEDTTVASMNFANGTLGTLAITQAASGDNWHFQKDIYGTQGSIHIVNESETPLILVKNKETPIVIPVESESTGGNWWKYSVQKGVSYFVDCILEGRDAYVKPEDARSALKTVLKLYESVKRTER